MIELDFVMVAIYNISLIINIPIVILVAWICNEFSCLTWSLLLIELKN